MICSNMAASFIILYDNYFNVFVKFKVDWFAPILGGFLGQLRYVGSQSCSLCFLSSLRFLCRKRYTVPWRHPPISILTASRATEA